MTQATAQPTPACAGTFEVDGQGRVEGFDAAFAELAAAATGRQVVRGAPFSEAVGEGPAESMRQVLERARAVGIATGLFPGWGAAHRQFRVEVRFDPGRTLFTLRLHRVTASDALDPDHELANALRHNVTEMIAVLDTELRIRAYNSVFAVGAAALLGRDPRAGDRLIDLLARSPGRGGWEALYARALGGEAVLEDLSVQLSIGVSRIYEVSLNPICGPSGDVRGVLMISRNVTPRRDEARSTLRAEELRRAILDALPEAVMVLSRDGTILEFKAAQDVPIPMTPQDFVGQKLSAMAYAATGPILEAAARAFADGQTHRVAYEATVDGAVRYREGSVRAINEREAMMVVRDVTEQRLAADRLAFADRMTGLGTLAAGVAHELNNPLSYIGANLVFLGEALAARADLDPSAHAALADAVEGVERMRSIVDGLRALSHAQDETLSVLDLRDVVGGALKLVRHEINARGTLEADLGDRVLVRGSQTRLSQVFVNLLLNAAQALDPSRSDRNKVRVRVSCRGEGKAEVEVADNGAGIPRAVKERIFEPFFTTKPVGEGTGLGLAIARQIVRRTGGDIEVESEPGEGARFRVVLPLGKGATRRHVAKRETGHPHARVLLVDDDAPVRAGLARLLSRWKITAVADGAAALEALATGTFELVLCDVSMPQMTGVELYLEVAARWPGRQERVTLMTGGQLTAAQRAALGANPPAVLGKPFDAAAVERRLDAVARLET